MQGVNRETADVAEKQASKQASVSVFTFLKHELWRTAEGVGKIWQGPTNVADHRTYACSASVRTHVVAPAVNHMQPFCRASHGRCEKRKTAVAPRAAGRGGSGSLEVLRPVRGGEGAGRLRLLSRPPAQPGRTHHQNPRFDLLLSLATSRKTPVRPAAPSCIQELQRAPLQTGGYEGPSHRSSLFRDYSGTVALSHRGWRALGGAPCRARSAASPTPPPAASPPPPAQGSTGPGLRVARAQGRAGGGVG